MYLLPYPTLKRFVLKTGGTKKERTIIENVQNTLTYVDMVWSASSRAWETAWRIHLIRHRKCIYTADLGIKWDSFFPIKKTGNIVPLFLALNRRKRNSQSLVCCSGSCAEQRNAKHWTNSLHSRYVPRQKGRIIHFVRVSFPFLWWNRVFLWYQAVVLYIATYCWMRLVED